MTTPSVPAMMTRLLLHPTVTLLCCLGLMLSSLPASAKTLVLAQISDRPKKDFRQLRPMADHIQSLMAHLGYDRADVELFPDIESLMSAIRQGRVHWVSETALTSAKLVQAGLASPVALKWKRGQEEYRSLIYVRKNSPVETLADLQGQRVAFEHPNSFSSYYLPAIALKQAGLNLQQLDTPTSSVAPDKVGYIFSRNERNNLLWVHKSIVTAGSLNDGDWQHPQRLPEGPRQAMRIIHRSAAYPRAFELATSVLSREERQALKQALLSLSSEEHANLLARYEQTERLTPVTQEHTTLLQQLDLSILP